MIAPNIPAASVINGTIPDLKACEIRVVPYLYPASKNLYLATNNVPPYSNTNNKTPNRFPSLAIPIHKPAMTTQAIWNGTTTVMFVILGFVLVKYLSLPVLAIALIGTVIAFAHFQNRYALMQTRPASATTQSMQEGDDFYD